MTRMLLWAIVGLVLYDTARAQAPPVAPPVVKSVPGKDVPPAARAEVLRRGNMVEMLGEGVSGEDNIIGEVMAPPPDDSDKWYISVVSQAGCPPCERLKADFMESDTLRAWVNVDDPAHSWAHYQVYRIEDETQRYRWEHIRLRAFPTLIIQPPRNGKYGKCATVVAQITGYDGNPDKLSKQMSDAIQRYIKHYAKRHRLRRDAEYFEPPVAPPTPPPFAVPMRDKTTRRAGGGYGEAAAVPVVDEDTPSDYGQQIGVDPPFDVGPKVDPRYPNGPVVDIPPPIAQEATVEQLKQYCTGADNDFIMEQLAQHATLEQALTAWRLRQGRPFAPFRVGSILAYVGVAIGVLFVMFIIVMLLAVVGFALRRAMANNAAARPPVAPPAAAPAAPPAAATAAPGETGLTDPQYAALIRRIEQDIKP